jgi:hypothetical protein
VTIYNKFLQLTGMLFALLVAAIVLETNQAAPNQNWSERGL